MNVSYEYLLMSRQLTWENAEVVDNFCGPVALEEKNEDWKEAPQESYKNTRTDGCVNDSLVTQRGCQLGYEETKKNLYVDLDYNKAIRVRVSLSPVNLIVNIEPPLRLESISNSSSSDDDPSIVATPLKCSQGDVQIVCTICYKEFICKSKLTRHLRTHTGDKPFNCPQCEKKFTKKRHLKVHLLVHSGVKEFTCNICHKAFAQKTTLTAHRRTHTGDKPFKCNECNAMFSQKIVLKRHMRTHTGETPYQCEICERKFTQLNSLKRHLLLHSEEKPFACTYANCDKTFGRKGDLIRHIRVHTKIKPYACPKCKKTFSQSGNCRTHAKQCPVTKSVSADDSYLETWEK